MSKGLAIPSAAILGPPTPTKATLWPNRARRARAKPAPSASPDGSAATSMTFKAALKILPVADGEGDPGTGWSGSAERG